MSNTAKIAALATLGLLGACSSPPQSIVSGPTTARPTYMVSNLENHPGAIFQPETARMLYEDPVARHIGDTLTILISENLSGNNTSTLATGQNTTEALKGPGATSSMGGLLRSLFNINMSGSSSVSNKSTGQDSSSHSFTGTLAVSIVDILPNGNYIVGGDRRVAMDGNEYALRFTGVVNRMDIHSGNIVDSKKVADARIEKVGQGQLADASSLGWLQRMFLSVMGLGGN